MRFKDNVSVSVIIVSYRVENYLRDCLFSLKEQSYSDFEVIVIDNSPNCKGSDIAKKVYPEALVYAPNENLFYSSALNKGIELSKGEFILCLNDDVILEKNFIFECLKGFADKNVGISTGKIMRMDRKTIDSSGLFLSIFYTPRERGYGFIDRGRFDIPGFVFGASGCVIFLRRGMLNQIKDENGYFDSNLKMFYEDLDISWRAQNKGWKSYYIPRAIAYHVRGGSCRAGGGLGKPIARKYLNDQLYLQLVRNRYIVMMKNAGFIGIAIHFVPVVFYELCSWCYTILFRPHLLKYLLVPDNKSSAGM